MKLNESIMKNLKSELKEATYPIASPNFDEDKFYGSGTNDDAYDALVDVLKYFTDFAAAVEEDAFTYQGADVKDLRKIVSLLTEARDTFDEMVDRNF